MKVSLSLGFIFLFFSIKTSLAQDEITNCYLFEHANVVVKPGVALKNTSVLIRDGIIVDVGANIVAPFDAKVYDCTNNFIYHAFIDGFSQTGIKKMSDQKITKPAIPSNVTLSEAGVNANKVANLDPMSKDIRLARKNGFAISNVFPHGQMLPGKSSIISLRNAKNEDALFIEKDISVVAQFRRSRYGAPGTTIGVMAKIRDAFRNAILQDKNISNHTLYPNQGKRPIVKKELEGLIPAATNKIPVYFYTPGYKDISRSMALQNDLGYTLVLAGVQHVKPILESIAAKRIPLLLALKLPKDVKMDSTKFVEMSTSNQALFERKLQAFNDYKAQASDLEKNNVPFGISLMNSDVRQTKQVITQMIAAGLSETTALAALTTNGAEILNISSTAGTIEKGKMANLMICDTSYFEKKSSIKWMVVDGEVFEYEVAKQTKKTSLEKTNGIEGLWSYEVPDINEKGQLMIEIAADSSHIISFVSESNPIKQFATDIIISNDNISMHLDFLSPDGSIPIKINLTMNATDFGGTISLNDGTFTISGTKTNPK